MFHIDAFSCKQTVPPLSFSQYAVPTEKMPFAETPRIKMMINNYTSLTVENEN